MRLKMAATFLMGGFLSLSARTWTSADGAKELEGDLKMFDAESGKVVIEVEGAEVEFALDKLSDEDQAFVTKQDGGVVSITRLLGKATVHQVVEGEMKEVSFEVEPKYYLLYFSASW